MSSKWDQQKTWAIYGDGELGGLATFEQLSGWRGTAHVLLKPDFQGKGVALRACRHAVAEMFGLGVQKLEFWVIARNLAIGSLLTNLGATREGTLREHTLVGGKPTDVWVYGLLKAKFEGKHELSIRVEQLDQQQQHADHDADRVVAVQPAE